jgi:hypothetical protein
MLIAAPAVAAIIATYMNYDPPPWSTNDRSVNRVKSIKEFLQSGKTTIERVADVPMIWNGADQAAHESATPEESSNTCDLRKRDTCDTDKPLECRGLQGNTYATRNTLSRFIDTEFCPRMETVEEPYPHVTYLVGTPEAVDIGVEMIGQKVDKPSSADCSKYLHEILDGCDQPGEGNPMNWKAGGRLWKGGWDYSITLLNERPPAPSMPSAWCTVDNSEVKMWGANWLDSGFGHELREGFEKDNESNGFNTQENGLGYDLANWNFQYEFMDGHEWFASIPVHLMGFDDKGNTEGIMTQTANFDGFVVDCV